MKKTKIICTAPISGEYKVLKDMVQNGMDVIRVDLSMSTHEYAKDIVSKIRKINKELNSCVGILFDTKGPGIKVGKFKDGFIKLEEGSKVLLTPSNVDGTNNKINISERNLYLSLDIDDEIVLEDNIRLVVTGIKNTDITCKVVKGGILNNNGSLNVPEVELNVDYLSIVDKNDILFASSLNVDFISLSFVRSANDILDVNDILIGERNEHISIISKIENQSAIDDLDNIIKVSDGVMFSRDKFSSNLEKLPSVEKKVINASIAKNKLCIISSEMLLSMKDGDSPSKLDISEISYRVLDMVDALVINKATSEGVNPKECVSMMSKILEETEKGIDYKAFERNGDKNMDSTSILSYAAVDMADMLDVKAIVASSISGHTARKISGFRPKSIIIVTTPYEEVASSLSLNWGVVPTIVDKAKSIDDIIDSAREKVKHAVEINKGDKIIVAGGFPPKKTRGTNFIKIEEM